MCVYIMQVEVMLSGKTKKTNERGRGGNRIGEGQEQERGIGNGGM